MPRLHDGTMSGSRKIRVLCFTDTNSGRDVEMILPIRYFAERFLNCEFIHAISFDSYQIYRTKPDIIFTPNTIGSRLYYRLAREASEQGIPLFSLVSEGIFKTDGSYDYWGYNEDRTFFQEFVCCWSKRTRDHLSQREPDAERKIVLTGNTGCDRYKIYETIDKREFLKKYNLPPYEKVIGYAGWAFNKLRFPRGVQELRAFYGDNPSIFPWLDRQRTLLNSILRKTIHRNKGTLFILKQHPHETSLTLLQQPVNELEGLTEFRNVLCLEEEEALHDVIGVCDLWTCFESTTALEAWLLNKPTVFLNPETEFKRTDLVNGSAVARSASEFQTMIDQLYATGAIPEFSSGYKAQERQRLVTDSVGYGDGYNHIRASYYLQHVAERLPAAPGPRYKFSPNQLLFHLFTIVGGKLYLRSLYKHLYKLKKHLWVFENYRMREIENLYSRYSRYLERFYREQQIEERYATGSLFRAILHEE